MKICSCYEGLEAQKKRILVRTHSSLCHGRVLSAVYCIECGKQSINYDNSLVIDIEELNVPLEAIVVEFDLLKEILNSNSIAPNTVLMFNIMQAIVWAYEVDYYERFDNYVFEDVRNVIIKFFIDNKSKLTSSFFNKEKNYEAYLKYVSSTLTSGEYEPFNLELALNDPNIFTSPKHSLYGPASLIHNEYTTPLGITRKSNNFYYPNDKYFRNNYSKLYNEAEIIYLSIKQTLCSYLVRNCRKFPSDLYFKVNSFQELRDFVLANNYGRNRVVLTGFLEVFKDILENADIYLNLTSRTYKDYLHQLELADAFVNEHLM